MTEKSECKTELSMPEIFSVILILRFYPDIPENRAIVDFLLNWDLGSLYQSIINAFFPILGFKAAVNEETLTAEKQQFHSKLQFLNDHLIKVTVYLDLRL